MADSEAGPCIIEFGREILHDEARALDALADSLGEPFETAVHLILDCRGKLIVSGKANMIDFIGLLPPPDPCPQAR